jgi:hypothetical protein
MNFDLFSILRRRDNADVAMIKASNAISIRDEKDSVILVPLFQVSGVYLVAINRKAIY